MTSINCNPKRSFISLLFPISYLLLFHAPAVTADLGFIQRKSNCTGGNYTANSKFQTNLSLLFSNLKSQSSSSNSNTATAGTDTNRAYGLYLCEGDLAHSDCQSCIQSSTDAIAQSCPFRRQAIIWSDYCMLRYSDTNFFGFPDTNGFNMTNPNEKTNSTLPYEEVSKLVQEAPFNQPLMFASNASATVQLYAMAQCTVDLNREGCKVCLTTILADIKSCCTQWKGWRYLATSCWIRYESSSFFDSAPPSGTVAPPSGTVAPPPPMSPEEDGGGEKKSSHTKIAAIVIPIVGVILLGPFLCYFWWWLRRRNARKRIQRKAFRSNDDRELQFMDLVIIKAATNNFSEANKLGEGGFGPVYKGMLHGGREIAVKRLSAKSKQGPAEFKNEVKLIAKLQHRNLARMLGCCVEGEEKLLIYEYLPNRSLDTFLFDPDKRSQLDWGRRHLIIAGIARGLLYLHEDSLLKVIHRDLKAGNVLLDNEMNPKISDFGMAKIYGADESEPNTNRIVGTFGYMAPEYAMDGVLSVKSDVYSFGVLLLEILSGQKNGRSHYEQHGHTLLKHAWQLWQEGKSTEMMDPLLAGSYSNDEAVKIIHIGLLCVQENAEDRPTMSLVVLMLRSEQMGLPQPAQPPTFFRQRTRVSDQSTSSTISSRGAHSNNEVTNSELVPR